MATIPKCIKSRKPRQINGVTVRPRWLWSLDYDKRVRNELRRAPTTHDYWEKMAERYARWLAERDGIDLSEANRAVAEWSYGTVTDRNGNRSFRKLCIEAVRFQHVRWRSRWYGSSEPEILSEIITIKIPNPDPVAAHSLTELSMAA